MPDETDFAVRDLITAVLQGDRTQAEAKLAALYDLESAHADSKSNTKASSDLLPYAQNLIDSLHSNPRAYRKATRELLGKKHLPRALRMRLEHEVADDPLLLGQARLRDEHQRSFGQVFNLIAAPVGHSMMSSGTPLVSFARSLIEWVSTRHLEDDLSLYERQALYHWQEELRRHPDSEDAPELQHRINGAAAELQETRRDQILRKARRALQGNEPDLALAFSELALRNTPEDPKALELGEDALTALEARDDQRAQSLEAPLHLDVPDKIERRLAVAMLLSNPELEAMATQILTENPKSEWADEARFALATLKRDRHETESSWKTLQEFERYRYRHKNMTLHAKTLLHDPMQNPYTAFESTRKSDGWFRMRWVLLGPLAGGARDRDLPRTLEWILDAPYFFDVLVGMPERILRYPWLSPWPFGRTPYHYANRYLERYPDGEKVSTVENWLFDYEKLRGNWIGAEEIAKRNTPKGVSAAKSIQRLAEKAAAQALESAKKQPRLEVRIPLLQEIVRRYPQTAASHHAGLQVRAEVLALSAQAIRISRGFLEENPEFAGESGLGLRPELLDGNRHNGELHPNGVTFEGGNTLAVHCLNERGNEKEAPVTLRQQIASDRLAEVVARLEEQSLALTLIDRDYEHVPDAQRDLFFERARLGVAQESAPRHAARSNFAFLGMREKYGLVRSRESILPIELVLQTSASDLSLGAFPRVKAPRKTSDSIFFE